MSAKNKKTRKVVKAALRTLETMWSRDDHV